MSRGFLFYFITIIIHLMFIDDDCIYELLWLMMEAGRMMKIRWVSIGVAEQGNIDYKKTKESDNDNEDE